VSAGFLLFRMAVVAGSVLVLVPEVVKGQAGSPAGAVPVERLAARRQALIARIQNGVAIIRGASELSNDPPVSDYPQATDFRQDNDFFYFTGLETRDSWLIATATDSAHGEFHLFVPPRNQWLERVTGPKLGPGPEAAEATGIPVANIHSADSVQVYLQRLVEQSTSEGQPGKLWVRRTERDSRPEFIRGAALQNLNGATRDLLPVLASLRVVKDSDEIRRLTRAVELSAVGHVAAMRFARPGVWEYEIEAVAEATFRRLGAERLGYPSIVGSGINSTILHYDENRRQTQAGDLIVMDMGAEFGYQTADVTRTIPVSGKFTPRQKAIYELVLGAQQAAIDSVRSGITLRQLDAIARRYMTDHSGDLCGAGGCVKYFIHGLSHWIGMDVHDVGGGVPLAPGMAFTVEPGIYIPEEALGVRIEDDVLVTPSGFLILSKGAPRAVADVERQMAGKRR
jgi:Xaa-Pro aminopeptidase